MIAAFREHAGVAATAAALRFAAIHAVHHRSGRRDPRRLKRAAGGDLGFPTRREIERIDLRLADTPRGARMPPTAEGARRAAACRHVHATRTLRKRLDRGGL
jgi:hypothetical protein